MNTDIHRKIFLEWRGAVLKDLELKEHFEAAIKKALTEYDTSIYENRFVVGGIIEYLVLAAINGSGIARGRHMGGASMRADICIESYHGRPCSENFSIKYSSSGAVRMVNVLGKSRAAAWNEPTLFVLPESGVIYADEAYISKKAIRRTADAIEIARKAILLHARKNPSMVLQVKIPLKRELKVEQTGKTASEDLARAMIRGFPRLVL